MKKNVPAKKNAKKTTNVRRSPASKVAKPRVKKPTAKTSKPAKAASKVMGRHIHPYGTDRHADLEWQLQRLENRLQQFSETDRETVRDALSFARERHDGQRRMGGSPFLIHPVRIANIIAEEWGLTNTDMIAAAILHDVVEDTQTTLKEVKDRFGNGIGKLVDGMTMWKGSETYEIYCKRVARGTEELRLVKCADVLDNLRSWHEADPATSYSRWWRDVNELVLPMAQSVSDGAAATLSGVLQDSWYLKKAGME